MSWSASTLLSWPWTCRRVRSSLDVDSDAFRRKLEMESLGGRVELDDHAVLIPHDGGAGAGDRRAFGAPANVGPVELVDRLHLEDLGARPGLREAEREKGEPIDLHGIGLALMGQGPTSPRVAEDKRYRGLCELERGVGQGLFGKGPGRRCEDRSHDRRPDPEAAQKPPRGRSAPG